MTKIVILIVFFGMGSGKATISEQFDTMAQCQSAMAKIVETYGETGFIADRAAVDIDRSNCIEIELPN